MKQKNNQSRYLSQQPQVSNGRKSLPPEERPPTGTEEEDAFKVYVRVRPLNQRELDHSDKPRNSLSIIKVQDNLVSSLDNQNLTSISIGTCV